MTTKLGLSRRDLARDAGLANQAGWCPVDPVTFESTQHREVHVIGDACIAGLVPLDVGRDLGCVMW